MAQFLRGKKFQSVVDVVVAVEESFASEDEEWFYQAFKELAEKWVKVSSKLPPPVALRHTFVQLLFPSVKPC
jgi:hypothetical protein